MADQKELAAYTTQLESIFMEFCVATDSQLVLTVGAVDALVDFKGQI